jgi:hypothetical protein
MNSCRAFHLRQYGIKFMTSELYDTDVDDCLNDIIAFSHDENFIGYKDIK